MFIKCQMHNMPALINVNKIDVVYPLDGGDCCGLTVDGKPDYIWHVPFDNAQDILIDCAAQVTAPIATKVSQSSKDVARYQWLKKLARLEGRDGGYCGVYTFPHIVQRDGRKVNHHDLDAAIDAEINSTNC